MTYARFRIAWFSLEVLAAWMILGLVSLAAVLLYQPKTWSPATPAEGIVAHEEWLADFTRNGYDLRSLSPISSLVGAPAEHASLAAAVEAADVIVLGSVVSLEHRTDFMTEVTFAVESYLKGPEPATTLLVYQVPGGPVPYLSGPFVSGQGYFHTEEWATFLFPGDRAFLLLQDGAAGQPAWPQYWTGVYRLSLGRVEVPASSVAGAEVRGLHIDDLLQRIRFVLSSSPRPQ